MFGAYEQTVYRLCRDFVRKFKTRTAFIIDGSIGYPNPFSRVFIFVSATFYLADLSAVRTPSSAEG